jgi:hypothetical protein
MWNSLNRGRHLNVENHRFRSGKQAVVPFANHAVVPVRETMPQVCAKELLLSTLAGTAVALAATLP